MWLELVLYVNTYGDERRSFCVNSQATGSEYKTLKLRAASINGDSALTFVFRSEVTSNKTIARQRIK